MVDREVGRFQIPWAAPSRFEDKPRLTVNETATIHKLLLNDGGIGVLSGFICEEDFRIGRLVHLLPEWRMPPLEVNVVYPS
jgi:DNA-binding transcriptional LysR family regulator